MKKAFLVGEKSHPQIHEKNGSDPIHDKPQLQLVDQLILFHGLPMNDTIIICKITYFLITKLRI